MVLKKQSFSIDNAHTFEETISKSKRTIVLGNVRCRIAYKLTFMKDITHVKGMFNQVFEQRRAMDCWSESKYPEHQLDWRIAHRVPDHQS